jgi:hypothetical protein
LRSSGERGLIVPIGRSVHLGVDVVSGFRYGNRVSPLQRANVDATELGRIAARRGFSVTALRNSRATTDNLLDAIRRAAAELRRDDTFVLTFSGHGLAAETHNGFQQSWCLFDDVLVRYGPDGLDAALTQFEDGVRVMIIANCCFAATGVGRTPPTPPIRAHVVRIASCRSRELALDTWEPDGPSPFVTAFKSALRSRTTSGFFPFFDRLRENRCGGMMPQIEVGKPRSEAFLEAGPFRLA